MRRRRGVAHARDAAVLHHRHAVGDLENLRHAVRDVDDRDALRREAPDDAEEVAALVDGQRRRGLVEDEQLQIVREALGDLHHLLLAGRELRDRRARIDVDLEVGEDAARAVEHRPAPDHAERVHRLTAGIDVLRDAQRADEAALLIDHGDAGVGGALLVQAGDRRAVELDRAAVRLIDAGDEVHERRLAGAVLADQRVHLAAPDLERHVVDRAHAGESLDDIANGEARRIDEGARDLPADEADAVALIASRGASRLRTSGRCWARGMAFAFRTGHAHPPLTSPPSKS